ncbi:MAG: FtsW/RodA/SpoVE family cell cycle protein [Chloroflexota bacterium]
MQLFRKFKPHGSATILPIRSKDGSGLQARLLRLAASFLFISSLVLTAAPAMRSQSLTDLNWNHWIGYLSWLISFALIHHFSRKIKGKPDPLLLSTTALLVGWGLLTIWRIAPYFGVRQSIWVAIGSLIFLLGLRLPSGLGFLRKYKYILLVGGLGLTGLTLIFGTNPMGVGPKLWLNFWGVYLQPSEPLKLLLLIYLAAYFADRRPFATRLIHLIAPTMIMAAVTLALLTVQHDLGTASIFIFIYAGMIYIATGKRRMLLVSLVILVTAAISGYLLFDLVQVRVESWLNPWLDPSGSSYQVIQSLISIAAGGVGGRGLGLGSPGLVPIAHSDFIFSSIAEEYGMVGSLALLLGLLILVFRGFKIGISASNHYQRYLALGISIYIASQSILIIGGNIRLLPLTGVTLPFVSYGGSSLVTSMLALLLLVKIDQHSDEERHSPLTRAEPVFHLATLLLLGFVSLALINSWWAVWRGPDLLTRTDNARRTLADYDLPRGQIVDRSGNPLHTTEGQAGEFFRVYQYPVISPVLGYTDPFYGQAGAESSLDNILRGLENNSPWSVWFNHLLYGQSPPGLDAKISLDLELQNYAAELFETRPGALVLLNAESGEVLAMHSSPTYDPNTLAEDWEDLLEKSSSPLLNRAAQGHYPIGTALNPFLLAFSNVEGELPAEIISLGFEVADDQLSCTRSLELPVSWAESLAMGCPGPAAYLGRELGAEALDKLYNELGLYSAPEIRLPVAQSSAQLLITSPEIAAIGQSELTISPLQLALAAASLSNQGTIPAPQFLLAAESSLDDWSPYTASGESTNIYSERIANSTAARLSNPDYPYWQTTANAYTQSGQKLTWYLAGTLPGAETPLVVVVLLEYHTPAIAQEIGLRVLQNAALGD